MKVFFVAVTIFSLLKVVYGQNSELEIFSENGYSGVELHSITYDEELNVYIAGTIGDGPLGQDDVLITKLDSDENLIWSKVIGTESIDSGKNVVIKYLSDSTLFVVGYSQESITSARDIFYSKLSSEGELIWSRQFISLNNHDTPRDILEVENGDILVCGSTTSISFGSTDGYVQKINPEGDVIWSFHYGGPDNEHFYGISKIGGSIVVCGNTESFDDTHHGLIIKLNSDGQFEEELVFTSNDTELFFSTKLVGETLVVVGYTSSMFIGTQAWVLGISADLNEINWCRRSTSSHSVKLTDVVILNEESFLVLGNQYEDSISKTIIWKLDTAGNTMAQFSSLPNANEYVSDVSGVGLSFEGNGVSLIVKSVQNGEGLTSGSLIHFNNEAVNHCDYEISYELLEPQNVVFQSISFQANPMPPMYNYPLQMDTITLGTTYTNCNIPCDLSYSIEIPETICLNDTLSLEFDNESDFEIEYLFEDMVFINEDVIIPIDSSLAPIFELHCIVNDNECLLDTVYSFEVLEPPAPFYLDTAICPNAVLELTFEEVVFSDSQEGLLGNTIVMHSNEEFIGLLGNSCGSAELHMMVDQLETLLDVNETIISCNSETIPLDSVAVWFDGNLPISEFDVQQGDSFELTLEAQTAGCAQSVQFTVVAPDWYEAIVNVPSTLCMEELEQYLYSNGIHEFNLAEHEADQTYSISFQTEACGEQEFTIANEANACDCYPAQLFVPNSFTPNADNLNDQFLPVLRCPWKEYHLVIFNRWGEQIFETTDVNTAWVGDVKGGAHYANEGVYSWLIEGRNAGTFFREKGQVLLLR